MGLGKILEGFIVVIVGINLAPTIANTVDSSIRYYNGSGTQFSTNITGASSVMLQLTVLFFTIGVMTAGIGIGVGGLQEIGLL